MRLKLGMAEKLSAMVSNCLGKSQRKLLGWLGSFYAVSIMTVMWACPALAENAPIGLLNSARNAHAYEEQHLGKFDDDYKAFRRTLESCNVRFDEISDVDAAAGPAKLSGYKLIVVPYLVDLSNEVVAALTEFQRGGGKLLITDGGGTIQASAQPLAQLAGAFVQKQTTFKEVTKLTWPRVPLAYSEDYAVGTMIADITLAPSASTLAKWEDASGAKGAIVRQGNAIFMGWAPGVQGDITINSQVISMALDELQPGITQQAAVQISFADFQTINQELEYLTKRTEETIKTAKQADFAVPYKVIQASFDKAIDLTKKFNTAYRERRFFEADDTLKQARQQFAMAFAQAMPVRPVEARSIWLDRGTIVACRNAKGMTQLFDKLKSSGINVIYFETNNAGYTMYPSKVAAQNPETVTWDPLGTAVLEAKKRGMEVHAWIWCFAVGNARHNPIIGKDGDYPGPVLSSHDFTWALQSGNGSLLPPKQFEYWLDPSNTECKNYIKALAMEIITRYPTVDGVQLDYIRYPFNNKGGEMGFNWFGRTKFEQETGLSLDKLDDETRQLWMAWKIQQINGFVKDISSMLRTAKPGIRISAAVYGMPRRLRIQAIQQEWETWVANGWVDTLNPMTYVPTAKELSDAAGYVRESTADRALVYPGLSIRQLDTAGLIEQLDSARLQGTLGTTMFAVAHLDDKKIGVLKVGPYRRQSLLTPQSEPIRASRLLVDDFAAMVNRYLQDPTKHILSDTASTNDVVSQIDSIQKEMHKLKPTSKAQELESVIKDVTGLHNTIKEWLRLEAFIQRGFRAQYIVNYLSQVEAILSYAQHRAKVQEGGPNPTMAGTTGM